MRSRREAHREKGSEDGRGGGVGGSWKWGCSVWVGGGEVVGRRGCVWMGTVNGKYNLKGLKQNGVMFAF